MDTKQRKLLLFFCAPPLLITMIILGMLLLMPLFAPTVPKVFPELPILGAMQADNLLLKNSAHLKHIGHALMPLEQPRTVSDLFTQSLDFIRAPIPFDCFTEKPTSQTFVSDLKTPAMTAKMRPNHSLRIMSYNVALLDYRLGRGFAWETQFTQSPLRHERRPVLAQQIFSISKNSPDVIFLQEVWSRDDLKYFTDYAQKETGLRTGYRCLSSPRDIYTDGLLTCISHRFLSFKENVQLRAEPYQSQIWREWWGAAMTSFYTDSGIKRGFHQLTFKHPTYGRIDLFNTHLQAYPSHWKRRMLQVRELGIRMQQAVSDNGLIVAGGDFNAAPYYPKDTWQSDRDGLTHGWWANTISYALLHHYVPSLNDLLLSAVDVLKERGCIDILAYKQPFPTTPTFPFTASSYSNNLYQSQYQDSEYPARLDYLFAAGGKQKAVNFGGQPVFSNNPYTAHEGAMLFTTEVTVGKDVTTSLSDHYGVIVSLKLLPYAASFRGQ